MRSLIYLSSLGSKRHLLLLLIGSFFMILGVVRVQAAVELVYFSAFPEDGRVILRWETATELDNAGFYINRSTEPDSGYQRINASIIPAIGDSLTGETYEFVDDEVINGTEYWYRLEAIDLNQNSTFYDAVLAVPGSSGTALPTATPSPTQAAGSTPQPTNTSIPASGGSSNPTPSRFPTPASTISNPYPGPSNSNIQQTSEPSSASGSIPSNNQITESDGPTATLIPFPTITVEFPVTDQPDQQGISMQDESAVIEQDQTSPSGLVRLWPIGVLVLIWGILITWFLITQRKI